MADKGFSRQQLQRFFAANQETPKQKKERPRARATLSPRDRSLELRARARQRLKESRFRALNEFFGSHSSSEAKQKITEELFREYHHGYAQLAAKWPQRPIDHVIARLRDMTSDGSRPVVADIGCGPEPLVGLAFPRLTVHSFDLVTCHPRVVSAEMTALPLPDRALDVAIFCLSLMSTDLTHALSECHRVLRAGACLLLVEVSSRFEDIHLFVRALKGLGFQLIQRQPLSGDFFTFFEFRRTEVKAKRVPDFRLKPAVYRTRI